MQIRSAIQSVLLPALFVPVMAGSVTVAFADAPAEVQASAESTRSLPSQVEQAKQHPLIPVREYAQKGLARFNDEVHDYSCTIIKRERIDGKLSSYQYLQAKIRHANQAKGVSFGVYLNFLKPSSLKGREVLYVQGQRQGDLLVRRGGSRNPNMTLQLDPRGKLAMRESRYPITEIGVKRLVEKLLEVMEDEIAHHDSEVKFFRNAKVNARPCTHIEVKHPTRKPEFTYHVAKVYVDNQLNVPIYFAAYDWPKEPHGKPVLLEEYAFTNVKLNVGLTDSDFDAANPDYHFLIPDQTASRDE